MIFFMLYTYIHLLNGRLNDEIDGNYTCITSNGTSVVEYLIASTKLFQYTTHFCVSLRDESYHLPFTSCLTLSSNNSSACMLNT